MVRCCHGIDSQQHVFPLYFKIFPPLIVCNFIHLPLPSTGLAYIKMKILVNSTGILNLVQDLLINLSMTELKRYLINISFNIHLHF